MMRLWGLAARSIGRDRQRPVTSATPIRTAGETRRYEGSVIDVLRENFERLWPGETSLRNQIV
jgi:hypothetical protein